MNIFQKFGHFILRLIKFFFYGSAAVAGMMFTVIFGIIVLVAITAVAGSGVDAEPAAKYTEEKLVYGDEDADKTFLAVDVTGVIMGDQVSPDSLSALFTEGLTFGYKVKEQLMEAAKDDDIDGILLVIDSPGGTIFGSQAIADGVAYYRQNTDKPVVVYIAGMAASGGYWSAVAGDVIVADHGTAIGSIGVIYGPFKYYNNVVAEDGGAFMGGVVTQGGVQTTYITAGNSKDLGNPYRQLTPDEINKLQSNVNDSYTDFVNHVASHRNMSEDKVRNELGAMIYGEKQARDLGMIDMIGSREDAYNVLAERGKADADDYKIIRQTNSADFWGTVFGAITRTNTPTAASLEARTIKICSLNSNVLAFHGDVAQLCP